MIPCQPVNDAALTASHIELEFGYIRVMRFICKLYQNNCMCFYNCFKLVWPNFNNFCYSVTVKPFLA